VTLGVAVALLLVVVGALRYYGLPHLRIRVATGRWEPVRHAIDKQLKGRAGSSVVLITGYWVPNQLAGDILRQRLLERWPDKVEVMWYEAHSHPRWAVVTTTETTLVTPVLGRQWLARMRLVCERERCRLSHLSLLWGGSSPTSDPVRAAPW
jgi:hypothetical protein